MAIIDGGEGGDGIHHQQRGVPGFIQGAAQGGDVTGDAGGGFVVDGHDGLDLMAGVGSQLLRGGSGVDTVLPIAGNVVDLQAEILGELRPQGGELAGLESQDEVAGVEGVDERRFRSARAGGREDEDRMAGLKDGLDACEALLGEHRELGPAMIDGGDVHGAQNAVGDVRGAGDLEKVAARAVGHGFIVLWGRGHAARPRLSGTFGARNRLLARAAP